MQYAGYINTKKLNLDIPKIRNSCNIMYDLIKTHFGNESKDYTSQATLTTQLFGKYNILMYPYDEFHNLYFEIQKMFRECYPTVKHQYYIQCWLNVYNKGDYIDWHRHWSEPDCFHGFFCVNTETEQSGTAYKIEGVDQPVVINSEDNLMILSPSSHDLHRSSPWNIEYEPRITIAFDLVPKHIVDPTKWLNHWIPI